MNFSQLRFRQSNEAGFTVPELLVVIIMTVFFVTLIVTFTFMYWRNTFLTQADLDTLTTRLNASDNLREAFASSSGLIIQNSISDTHTNNPDPTISSNLYWLPIHAVPSTTNTGGAGTTTPLLYFRRLSVNGSGAVIMNGTQPYEDEFVLYLDGSSKKLLMRSLANPSAAGNRLQTSCPPTSATSACPPDKIIATDVASIASRYFSRTGNPIDYTSITDPNTGQYAGPDFPAVEVIELTISLTLKPVFQQTNATQNSTVIRIALRNT